MGKVFREKLHGMGWLMKSALILLITLTLMIVMNHGGVRPDQSFAAGNATIADCGGCHGYTTSFVDGTAVNVPAGRFPGAHGGHVITNSMACSACHTVPATTTSSDFAHANGLKEMDPAKVTYAGGACTNSACHGSASPAWGTTANPTCKKCHSDTTATTSFTTTAQTTSSNNSKIHVSHINSTHNITGAGIACADCHLIPGAVGENGHYDSTLPAEVPMNGTLASKNTARSFNSSTKQCTNVYCHGSKTPDWDLTALNNTLDDCKICHDLPPTPGSGSHTGLSTVTLISGLSSCSSVSPATGCHPTINASPSTYSNIFADVAKHVNGTVEGGSCVGCHNAGGSGVVNGRVAITPQFDTDKYSHHVQTAANVTNTACYACHFEADSGGNLVSDKHKNKYVDLAVYTTDRAAASMVTYSSGRNTNSIRTEMAKINSHCLGCHSSTDPAFQPFGDGKSPSEYSWEAKPTTAGGFGAAQDIASKYNSTTTTLWGKFTGGNTNVNNKSSQTKAYSAHGNAAANQRGWSTLAENLQTPTAVANFPNTSGTVQVLCYDCHNSHGSSTTVASANAVTTSYSSATGRNKGGILKATTAGAGGYAVAYRAYSGGNLAQKNAYKAGAGICFDCHNNANAGTPTYAGNITPWGYNTFGATQMIHGYNDNPYFGKTGATFPKGVTYPFLVTGGLTVNKGGHLHASSPMTTTPGRTINGLCTGCHDPHGVSNGLAAADRQYAVPLLKGTFVTSPYKQDIAPANTNEVRGGGSQVPPLSVGSTPGYHIDQNTMQLGTTGKPSSSRYWAFATTATTLQTLNDTQFAGLCLGCHSKASLNNTAAATTSNWKTMTRIHNTVKGWALTSGTGGNVNNKVHAFTCSKCHSPHNSNLPRLLVTNCLDVKHRGRVTTGGDTGLMTTTSGSRGAGLGRFPGGGSYGHSRNATTATNPGPWFFGVRTTTLVTTANLITTTRCHDSATAGGTTWTTNGSTQYWNTKSLW